MLMEPFLTLFGLVTVAFASTNIDNLLLLISWQLGGGLTSRRLFAGYLLGMAGVLGISILAGLVGYLMPLEHLGYLGLIPMLVGLRMLVVNLRSKTDTATDFPAGSALSAGGGVAAIAAMQLSNGVDTILIFAPLLADSQFAFDVEIALLFLLLVVLWFLLARFAGIHASRLRVLTRAGRWLTPVVMIVVGAYIVSNTATDRTGSDLNTDIGSGARQGSVGACLIAESLCLPGKGFRVAAVPQHGRAGGGDGVRSGFRIHIATATAVGVAAPGAAIEPVVVLVHRQA